MNAMPMLVEIILWNAKYDPKTAVPKKFIDQAKGNRQKLINQIRGALKQNKDFFQSR